MNDAQAELHAAFVHVVDRYDSDDPRTRRWLNAVAAFRAAQAHVYSDALREVDQGAKRASELDTADMLDFLEADPFFFGSGYMKEKLLRALKRRKLSQHDVARLQAIIIAVIQKHDHRREFLHYCRVAVIVDDECFRSELEALERSDDPGVERRANWVVAAVKGKWADLKLASRAARRGLGGRHSSEIR